MIDLWFKWEDLELRVRCVLEFVRVFGWLSIVKFIVV